MQKKSIRRLIGLLKNTMIILACAGCSGGLTSAQMLIITTGNTGRRIMIPKNQRYRQKSGRFTMSTEVWMDTEA